MTIYDDNVQQAIEDRNIELLIQYAYGYPCRCTTVKGEAKCICKMQADALRNKLQPRPLFQDVIQPANAPSQQMR